MAAPLRLAVTADLHWGPHPAGDAATRRLVGFLADRPPDVLILAGDVGAADDFGRCLELFQPVACRKALVPGNHDVWVNPVDDRGDSLRVYREVLPRICAENDFVYLDQQPLMLPELGLAVVGSINWYDYSWSIDRLRERVPDYEHRLAQKLFQRGRHNDARFVRWPFDDAGFTAEVVGTLEEQLDAVLGQVEKAVVVTHHPPFRGLNFPPDPARPEETLDQMLWEAFSGNAALEGVLERRAGRIPLAFCGHTHRAREAEFHGVRGYNVGGDYHFKRLLMVDLPAGTVEPIEFFAETQDPA